MPFRKNAILFCTFSNMVVLTQRTKQLKKKIIDEVNKVRIKNKPSLDHINKRKKRKTTVKFMTLKRAFFEEKGELNLVF